MAASMEDMQLLHKIVVKSLVTRIEQDMEDNLPTDAATLGAAIKMLKDNNVSADPADKEDLSDLREKLTAQREARKNRGANVIDLVKQDLLNGTGG